MFKFVKYLSTGIVILKTVKELVIEFERSGHGKAKKKAVLDVISVLCDTGGSFIPLSKSIVLETADKLIEIIVNFYNIVGLFKHRKTTATEVA